MENIVDCTLRTVIDRFARKPGGRYLRFEIEDGPFSWSDGNQSCAKFGRIVYRIDDKDCHSDSLVLKCHNASQRFNYCQELQVMAFQNEITFYTTIVPIYRSFRNVELFPKFYNSIIQSSADSCAATIVFENLQATGFVPCAKRSILDVPHLRLMVRKLGEFHAFSLKAKRENVNFESIANSMQNSHVEYNRRYHSHLFAGWCERGIRPLLADVKYAHKVPHLRKLCANSDRYFIDVWNGTMWHAEDVLVLCHADYLVTNVLFKYHDGVPVDLKMVDMANCRMASPVVDLALMLYMHSDQATRDAHWDELIDEYCESLRVFSEIDVPSREQILREFQIRGFYAYFIASFYQCVFIALDRGTPVARDIIPEEYRNRTPDLIPTDLCIEATLKTGGEFATECVVNILKDMIDRGFV